MLIGSGADVARIDVLGREGATLRRMAVGAATPERDLQQRELVGTDYALTSQTPWAVVARTRVGGDFYDRHAIEEGRWAVVVGKGAEAAAVTAMARYTLRAATIVGPSTPRAPSRCSTPRWSPSGGRSASSPRCSPRCAWAATTPSWRVACAGHPAPIVVRASGAVEAVDAGGPLLGVADGIHWRPSHLRLGPGDAVVL